jgi:hypothetical protein
MPVSVLIVLETSQIRSSALLRFVQMNFGRLSGVYYHPQYLSAVAADCASLFRTFEVPQCRCTLSCFIGSGFFCIYHVEMALPIVLDPAEIESAHEICNKNLCIIAASMFTG